MLEPAKTVIGICGGVAATAEMAGVTENRVRRWTYPRASRGTGGLIPTRPMIALLSGARRRGIDLRPDHFIPVCVDETEGAS